MRLFFVVLFYFSGCLIAFSQNKIDTLKLKTDSSQKRIIKYYPKIDSAALIRKNQIRDSISYFYLKPNPLRPNPYFEKLMDEKIITDPYLLSPPKNIKIVKLNFGLGQFLPKSPIWPVYALFFILFLFGIVKVIFDKEISLIFRAFFDNRILTQINKEDNALVSWQFLFLYIIFSITLGLFISVIMFKINSSVTAKKFETFIVISGLVFVFFGLKILILRLIGFIFEIRKLIRDYLNLIYLTCFNSLFLLLPITFCLIFVNNFKENSISIYILLLFLIIIGVQFIRITINILLNYRLSKFYLILYLCALEISPIILLAKTINISL